MLLVTLLMPVNAVLLGVALLDEHIEPRQVAGMALIAAGLAVIDGRLPALVRRLPRVPSEGSGSVHGAPPTWRALPTRTPANPAPGEPGVAGPLPETKITGPVPRSRPVPLKSLVAALAPGARSRCPDRRPAAAGALLRWRMVGLLRGHDAPAAGGGASPGHDRPLRARHAALLPRLPLSRIVPRRGRAGRTSRLIRLRAAKCAGEVIQDG